MIRRPGVTPVTAPLTRSVRAKRGRVGVKLQMLELVLRAAAPGVELVSSMSLAVVRSDEGTTLYLSTTFGL